jgi:hypothetical protein
LLRMEYIGESFTKDITKIFSLKNDLSNLWELFLTTL